MRKRINLYQKDCYPKREKFIFSQFLILSFCCATILLLSYLITRYQAESLKDQIVAQETNLSDQQLTLANLKDKLQKNRAPDGKIRQHRVLQNELVAKQSVIASFSSIDVQDLVSFSVLMRGLSYANMSDLTIKHFSMTAGILSISGNAKYSDSVPLWLSNIQVTKELSNVAFKALSIKEATGFFTFQLTNSTLKGQEDE